MKRNFHNHSTLGTSSLIKQQLQYQTNSLQSDVQRFSSTVEEKVKWVFEKLKGILVLLHSMDGFVAVN
jgi:hypothetical protein